MIWATWSSTCGLLSIYFLLSLPLPPFVMPYQKPYLLCFQNHLGSVSFLFLYFSPKEFSEILWTAKVNLDICSTISTKLSFFVDIHTQHQTQPQSCSKICLSPKALCCLFHSHRTLSASQDLFHVVVIYLFCVFFNKNLSSPLE